MVVQDMVDSGERKRYDTYGRQRCDALQCERKAGSAFFAELK